VKIGDRDRQRLDEAAGDIDDQFGTRWSDGQVPNGKSA